MKWYWAITLTVAIVAIFALLEIPTSIVTIVVGVFAIWVAADSSSFGWGIFVFLFWPIAYPWYLIVRPEVLSGEEKEIVRPKVLPSEEEVREEMFVQASRLDQRGDWPEAIALYEQLAEESQDRQDAEYARNCARQIREKMTNSV